MNLLVSRSRALAATQDSVFVLILATPPLFLNVPPPRSMCPLTMTAGRQSRNPPLPPTPEPPAAAVSPSPLPAPDLSFVAFAGTSFRALHPSDWQTASLLMPPPSNRNPVPKQISIISSDASSQSDIGDAETRHPLEAPVHQATASADEPAGAPPFENLDSMESKSIQVMARSLNKGISRAMLAPYLYPKTQTSQYPILHGARTSSLDCSGQTNALPIRPLPHSMSPRKPREEASQFLLPHASQNDKGLPTRTSPEQTRLNLENPTS